MFSPVAKLLATPVLAGMMLSFAIWPLDNVRLEEPACPRGTGHGFMDLRWLENSDAKPPDDPVQKLLSRPNFGATPQAADDLKTGIVDERLQSALLTVTEKHRICVQTFKEGHQFLLGEEDGPTIPEGYGEAGGLPNTHYFGRAADIFWIDGEPVEGNGTKPTVLDVGHMLAEIPPGERPDQIIGPPGWTSRLGYEWAKGWVLSKDQLDLHKDHLHIGYREDTGTDNTQ